MDFDNIDSKTTICGIIGKPLGHSLSPAMHNAAFAKLGLDFIYLALEIEKNELKDTLKELVKRDFRGLNVTLPYKIAIMDFLDEIDDIACEIGAVNTLVNRNGTLKGYNTDSIGAMEALKRAGVELENSSNKILILGAGGAARAVATPLAKMGSELIIANRTHQKGEELAGMLSKFANSKAIGFNEIGDVVDEVNILINCTSAGMKGGLKDSPFPTHLLRSDLVVFDIVYSPKDTPLLLAAKKAGAKIIYGYEMFIYQGAAAFELWTGHHAPEEVMREVVINELKSGN